MIRKVFTTAFITVLPLLFTACSSVGAKSGDPANLPLTQIRASEATCNHYLKMANANLALAKKVLHGGTNWSPADAALADAVRARQQKDFNACVSKAQQVNDFVERDQNYLKWKQSLRS